MAKGSFLSPRSSTIVGARFNNGILEVDFKRGDDHDTYIYNPFPAKLWASFEAASSKGTFMANFIRPRFKGVKKSKVQPIDLEQKLKASLKRKR